jgi:hypothetical protein
MDCQKIEIKTFLASTQISLTIILNNGNVVMVDDDEKENPCD